MQFGWTDVGSNQVNRSNTMQRVVLGLLVIVLLVSSTQLIPTVQASFWTKLMIVSAFTHAAIVVGILIYYRVSVATGLSMLLSSAGQVAKGKSIVTHECNSNQLNSLDALIKDLSDKWSREARTMQFDIEFTTIEAERRRVAKELHDEVLPSLSRLTRTLQPTSTTSNIKNLTNEIHAAIASLRDVLGELHPVDLEELGLVYAISNLCSRYVRLTGRSVYFVEHVEEFPLSETQALCLYRAMQAVLQMFNNSENDILVVSCGRIAADNVISVRCVDKRVSSAEWLSIEKQEFADFESWLSKAGATVAIGTIQYRGFPCDLIISVPVTEGESC
jgi:signal transduction histidine kinase